MRQYGLPIIPLKAAPALLLIIAVTGCADFDGYRDVSIIQTAAQFKRQVVYSKGTTLVRFYSPENCTCKKRSPTFGRLAKDYRGEYWFAQVNTKRLPELSQQYAIQRIPSVLLFVNGQEVSRLVGKRTESEYETLLELAETTRGRRESEMNERSGLVTFKGAPLTLLGEEVGVGDDAHDFTAVAPDMSEVRLSDLRGKVVLIAAVPSLDTPVCNIEAKRFNDEAAKLGEDVKVLVISMDLPFAQKRWCGAGAIESIQTLSDHRGANFGTSYGVLIKELQLLARSVWVVDGSGKIRYVELVGEVTQEPDYEAALSAARELINE